MVSMHGLIMTTIADKNFSKEDIQRASENMLNGFFCTCEDQIRECPFSTHIFREFKDVLFFQVQDLLGMGNCLELLSGLEIPPIG